MTKHFIAFRIKSLKVMRVKIYPFFIKFRWFLYRKGFGRIPRVVSVGRGIVTIGRFVDNRTKPKGIVLFNLQGNKIYVNTADEDIFLKFATQGDWEEPYETELFKQMVKEGMVVIDIGANIGYYTLIASKLVGQKGIVYAFEPKPSNYELLCKNIEANGYTNVVPVQKAVSNKYGRAKLWFQEDRGVSSSFSKYAALRFSRSEGLEKGSFTEVETVTLDGFFRNITRNIDIIKMDAEGAEGLIVNGAEKVLRKNNLKLFMEFWSPGLRDLETKPLELISKLQNIGFRIQSINEGRQALEPFDDEKAEYVVDNLFLEK